MIVKNTLKSWFQQLSDVSHFLRYSNLTHAFRSELGTNDPADESAEVLLKRILQGENYGRRTCFLHRNTTV